MRNSTSKSFAHQYGITQKNLSNNPSSGIGLNPNLNIEDEYIQNLLKQVHFLNMEIKLIKQKQKENKGMGIMGLLNKDQNPVVTHAVTSNNKYSDMKNNLSQQVNSAEVDYIRLDDENFAVKAQRDFVEKREMKQQQKNIQNKLYVDKVLNENRQRLSDQLKKLKEQREDYRRTTDAFNRITQQNDDLKTKTKTKKLMKQTSENLEKEVQALREDHFNKNQTKLKSNQSVLTKADQGFRSDPSYLKLVDENNELKDRVKQTDKELFDLAYQAKEMDEKKKLSIRNKDVQAELKKQAIQESQRLKKKLADKNGDLQVKLKEAKSALDSNDEVRLLKGKIARRDKQINDLKKKTQVSQTNYKRLKDQVEKLQTNLGQKKQSNKEREKKINNLKAIQNEIKIDLTQSELNFEKNNSDLTNFQTSLKENKTRLDSYQEEFSYLVAKEEFLIQEINIDQDIKNVKIEQLTTLAHANSGLNETISTLMQKWDQVIKFSRQNPSSI